MESESNWPAIEVLFGVNTMPFIISCDYITTENKFVFKWVKVGSNSDYQVGIEFEEGNNLLTIAKEVVTCEETKRDYICTHTCTLNFDNDINVNTIISSAKLNARMRVKNDKNWSQPKSITVKGE